MTSTEDSVGTKAEGRSEPNPPMTNQATTDGEGSSVGAVALDRVFIGETAYVRADEAARQIMALQAKLYAQPRGEGTEAVAWVKMAERQPEPGCKFVALFDDGSGAWLGFAHDGGVIDSDGDDYSKMPNAEWWAYLPTGFRLCCEDHPAEALTLPEYVCPPLAHPSGAEAPSVVQHPRPEAGSDDQAAKVLGSTGRPR